MERRTRARASYSGAPSPGVPEPIDDDVPPARFVTDPLTPGDRIGRYIIRYRLGRGGMGVVYGAFDPALGRRVALKLVRHRDTLESLEAHGDERLRREAQALARLSHPNVVSLYDVGVCRHGDFLALELVPGINLDRWLRKRIRTWEEIVDVFLPAGRGLAAAHIAGLIHRDFKPTNVIVGPQGHVTVVDFGLARSAELDPTVSHGDPLGPDPGDAGEVQALLSAKLTGDNMIVGTHGYIAPEQMLGLTVGPRADQFSFCVALYEALYGVRPYPGRNAVQVAMTYVDDAPIDEPEDPKRVPPRVREALLRGLSIDPEARFSSMNALLAELRRCRAAPWSSRRWLAALLATAAVSASIGAWVDHVVPRPTAVATPDCREAGPVTDDVVTPSAP